MSDNDRIIAGPTTSADTMFYLKAILGLPGTPLQKRDLGYGLFLQYR